MAALDLKDGAPRGYGWLHSGWSQEEDASPHIIGDETGETIQRSFTAQAGPDSDLRIGPPDLNLEPNPRALEAGTIAPYGTRYSWTRSYRIIPTTGPTADLTTAIRFTANESGTLSGQRGFDSYGNYDGTFSPSGIWMEGPFVTPGETITISRYVRRANITMSTGTVNQWVRFHDGAGNWTGAATVIGSVVTTAGAWARLVATVQVPAGGVRFSARTSLEDGSTYTSGSSYLEVTGLMTERSAVVSDWSDQRYRSGETALEVTLQADQAQTSTYDLDSGFLPVRKFPLIGSGHEEAAVDAFQREYKNFSVTLPWQPRGIVHAYYPLRGHGTGYAADGTGGRYIQPTWGEGVNPAGTTTGSLWWGKSAALTSAYTRLPESNYAIATSCLHSSINSGTNVNYQSFRCRVVANSAIHARINLQWAGNLETNVDLDIEGTTGTVGQLKLSGIYRQHNASSSLPFTTITQPLVGLTTDNEIGIVMQWGFLTSAAASTLRVKVYAFDPLDPPIDGTLPATVMTLDLPNAMRASIASQNSTITRNAAGRIGFRDLILSQSDSSWPVHCPKPPEPDLIDLDIPITNFLEFSDPAWISLRQGAIYAWEGSGWDYLKMLCTGRGLKMKVNGSKLDMSSLYPVDSVQPLVGAVSPPVLKVQAAGRARSIDVARNTSWESRFYTTRLALMDVNIKLELGTEQKYVFDFPTGDHQRGLVTALEIVDGNGRDQTWWEVWLGNGRMITSIDENGRLTVTFRAPTRENVNWVSGRYTGYGPWTITKLNFGLQGSVARPDTITLYTGAPEEMVTRDKGGNVDNPFLTRSADVFDRSTWLISSEGSPRVSLDFTVGSEYRSYYAVGQVVSYGWGHFRVMSVTEARGTISIRADWFATQAQQTANWSGMTANQWNQYWAGKRAYDVFIRPMGSSVPVVDPTPFVRIYPSETTNPVQPTVVIPGGSVFGTGVFGSGTPYGY